MEFEFTAALIRKSSFQSFSRIDFALYPSDKFQDTTIPEFSLIENVKIINMSPIAINDSFALPAMMEAEPREAFT